MEQVLKKEKQIQAKPIMKWAGGKTQMLGDIMPKIPQKYGKYIEPFIGGGALFFALSPDKAIVADSNPELINMYRQVADNVEAVISYLKKYKNTKEDFYEVRSLDWFKLKKEEAAARTIYLNKTCFNGLYRVNKKGQFNVPFGKYKAPNFCDEEALFAASDVLKKATITCGDYLSVLKEYAEPGDFIFLDPPYLPISEYSDFKRYTKEQFYEEDHVELAKEVKRLQELGCHVILTNSNHPLVHELYADYKIEVIQTAISANAFKNNKSLKSVTIGRNVTVIGTNAFYGCRKLSRVSGGNGIVKIDHRAFANCISLSKITIPGTVRSIGKQAFRNCKKLRSITIKTSTLSGKTIGSKAFAGTYKKPTVKVPAKQLKAYKKLLKARGMSSKAVYRK